MEYFFVGKDASSTGNSDCFWKIFESAAGSRFWLVAFDWRKFLLLVWYHPSDWKWRST